MEEIDITEEDDDDLEITFVGPPKEIDDRVQGLISKDSSSKPSVGLRKNLSITSAPSNQSFKKLSPAKLPGFQKTEQQVNKWLTVVKHSKVTSPYASPINSPVSNPEENVKKKYPSKGKCENSIPATIKPPIQPESPTPVPSTNQLETLEGSFNNSKSTASQIEKSDTTVDSRTNESRHDTSSTKPSSMDSSVNEHTPKECANQSEFTKQLAPHTSNSAYLIDTKTIPTPDVLISPILQAALGAQVETKEIKNLTKMTSTVLPKSSNPPPLVPTGYQLLNFLPAPSSTKRIAIPPRDTLPKINCVVVPRVLSAFAPVVTPPTKKSQMKPQKGAAAVKQRQPTEAESTSAQLSNSTRPITTPVETVQKHSDYRPNVPTSTTKVFASIIPSGTCPVPVRQATPIVIRTNTPAPNPNFQANRTTNLQQIQGIRPQIQSGGGFGSGYAASLTNINPTWMIPSHLQNTPLGAITTAPTTERIFDQNTKLVQMEQTRSSLSSPNSLMLALPEIEIETRLTSKSSPLIEISTTSGMAHLIPLENAGKSSSLDIRDILLSPPYKERKNIDSQVMTFYKSSSNPDDMDVNFNNGVTNRGQLFSQGTVSSKSSSATSNFDVYRSQQESRVQSFDGTEHGYNNQSYSNATSVSEFPQTAEASASVDMQLQFALSNTHIDDSIDEVLKNIAAGSGDAVPPECILKIPTLASAPKSKSRSSSSRRKSSASSTSSVTKSPSSEVKRTIRSSSGQSSSSSSDIQNNTTSVPLPSFSSSFHHGAAPNFDMSGYGVFSSNPSFSIQSVPQYVTGSSHGMTPGTSPLEKEQSADLMSPPMISQSVDSALRRLLRPGNESEEILSGGATLSLERQDPQSQILLGEQQRRPDLEKWLYGSNNMTLSYQPLLHPSGLPIDNTIPKPMPGLDAKPRKRSTVKKKESIPGTDLTAVKSGEIPKPVPRKRNSTKKIGSQQLTSLEILPDGNDMQTLSSERVVQHSTSTTAPAGVKQRKNYNRKKKSEQGQGEGEGGGTVATAKGGIEIVAVKTIRKRSPPKKKVLAVNLAVAPRNPLDSHEVKTIDHDLTQTQPHKKYPGKKRVSGLGGGDSVSSATTNVNTPVSRRHSLLKKKELHSPLLPTPTNTEIDFDNLAKVFHQVLTSPMKDTSESNATGLFNSESGAPIVGVHDPGQIVPTERVTIQSKPSASANMAGMMGQQLLHLIPSPSLSGDKPKGKQRQKKSTPAARGIRPRKFLEPRKPPDYWPMLPTSTQLMTQSESGQGEEDYAGYNIFSQFLGFGGIKKQRKKVFTPRKIGANGEDGSGTGVSTTSVVPLFNIPSKLETKKEKKPRRTKSGEPIVRKCNISKQFRPIAQKPVLPNTIPTAIITTFPLSPDINSCSSGKNHTTVEGLSPPMTTAAQFGFGPDVAKMLMESGGNTSDQMQFQPFPMVVSKTEPQAEMHKPRESKQVVRKERPSSLSSKKDKGKSTPIPINSPKQTVLFKTDDSTKSTSPISLPLSTMAPTSLPLEDSNLALLMSPSVTIQKLPTPEAVALKLNLDEWKTEEQTPRANRILSMEPPQDGHTVPVLVPENRSRSNSNCGEDFPLSVKIIMRGKSPARYESPISGKHELLVQPILSLTDCRITNTSENMSEMSKIEKSLEKTSLQSSNSPTKHSKHGDRRVSRRPIKYQDPGAGRRTSLLLGRGSKARRSSTKISATSKITRTQFRVVDNPGFRWTYTENELRYLLQQNAFLVNRRDMNLETEKVTLWRVLHSGEDVVILKAYEPYSRKDSNRWFHISNWIEKSGDEVRMLGEETITLKKDLRHIFTEFLPVYVTRICDSPEVSVVKYHRDPRLLPHIADIYNTQDKLQQPLYNCIRTLVYHAMDSTFLDKVIYTDELENVSTEVQNLRKGWNEVTDLIKKTCLQILSSPRWSPAVILPILKFPKMNYSVKRVVKDRYCDACQHSLRPLRSPTKLVTFEGLPYNMTNLQPSHDKEEESKPDPDLNFCHTCNMILKTFHTLYHTRYNILLTIHFRLELILKEFEKDAKIDSISLKRALDADIDWYKAMLLDFLITLSQARKDIDVLGKQTYITDSKE